MYNPRMRRSTRGTHPLGAAALFFAIAIWSAAARAEAPWVWRGLVVPRGQIVFDLGVGLGHFPNPQNGTGFGLNLELKAGIAPNLELGIRTGIRTDDFGRLTHADSYARPFDLETWGTNYDTVANPELHLKWAVARGPAAQLGLELAAYLPIESGSRFGMMFALPLALHANSIRVDSGIYVPIIFSDQTWWALSVPIQLWIQATRTFYLGPVFAMNFIHGDGGESESFPFGFGLGGAIAPSADVRAWFVFPDISAEAAARRFGAGFAFELRFG